MNVTFIDIAGYLASLVLLISFTRKNVKQLRIINTVGCLLFVLYGGLLEAWPVMVTNICIVLINVYYLFFQKSETSKTSETQESIE